MVCPIFFIHSWENNEKEMELGEVGFEKGAELHAFLSLY